MEIRQVSCVRSSDVRCTACGALLAKQEPTGLSIRRGDLQATIDGAYRVTLVCYRPRCRTLNIVEHAAPSRRAASAVV